MGRSALPTHVGPGLGPTLMCCVEDVGSKVMFGSYNLFMYFFFAVYCLLFYKIGTEQNPSTKVQVVYATLQNGVILATDDYGDTNNKASRRQLSRDCGPLPRFRNIWPNCVKTQEPICV